MKKRILVLIDGFNYYHKLDNYQKNNHICVKWLDYMSLLNLVIQQHLNSKDFELDVIFFSAIAKHRSKHSQKRHKDYLKALNLSGVKTVLGEFKEKPLPACYDCKQGKKQIMKHEEKHTDVNIAITMLEKAMTDQFDRVYLLSADNDYVPAIKRTKELYPNKEIIICPPPQKHYAVHNLKRASGEKDFFRIKWKDIKTAQFPNVYYGINNPWFISNI